MNEPVPGEAPRSSAIARRMKRLELWLTVIAGALAVPIGLQTLYANEATWGSSWTQALGALLFGLGAQQLVGAGYTGVTSVRDRGLRPTTMSGFVVEDGLRASLVAFVDGHRLTIRQASTRPTSQAPTKRSPPCGMRSASSTSPGWWTRTCNSTSPREMFGLPWESIVRLLLTPRWLVRISAVPARPVTMKFRGTRGALSDEVATSASDAAMLVVGSLDVAALGDSFFGVLERATILRNTCLVLFIADDVADRVTMLEAAGGLAERGGPMSVVMLRSRMNSVKQYNGKSDGRTQCGRSPSRR